MLQCEAPNIFKPRTDWNVKAMKCKSSNNDYADFIQKASQIIHEITGFNPLKDTSYRGRDFVVSRQILMVILCEKNHNTMDHIGNIMGKDRCTVIHAKKTIQDLRDTDKAFNEMFNRILNKVELI
jgi:hypothetical protein